ncbi:MAG: hypothetical protein E6Q61_05475 [Nitrosomonas sp.]|nr:MAG: hypothetical protein E6Q61_05475 [Nitrosomonas sp.]
MKFLIYSSLFIYISFYIFEAPLRYAFALVGLDNLIFIRDIILLFPLSFFILFKQLLLHRQPTSFIIFSLIILVHGLVSYLNFQNFFILLYSTKVLSTALVGALIAPYVMKPHPKVIHFTLFFWLCTAVGLFLDKYILTFPWIGMTATIGDIVVDVGKDWMIAGEDKRVGGFMRSSINAAIGTPILSFLLILHLQRVFLKICVLLVTLVLLYWTTQKASILAFLFTCSCLVFYKRPIPLLKLAITFALLLMIALPTVLPLYEMPTARGVFTLGSFYMRVEDVWPRAWIWIERNSLFPFGVGLGGIGGAMRFYAPDDVNYADNMFLFFYACFGLFAFVYMIWIWLTCIRVKNSDTTPTILALSVLSFLLFYGSALTVLEDQMASLFFGAALSWLATLNKKRARIHAAQ